MKKLLLISGILGGVIILMATISVSTLAANKGRSEVKITSDYIWIGGATALQPADRTALENTLRQADKSLFKVTLYDKGKPKRMGTLGCLMKSIAESTDTDVKARGVSDCAFQIGARKEKASPSPAVACNNPTLDHAKADQLLRKVEPILKKYAAK